MKKKPKIVIQGIPGCFHEEAARKFFGSTILDLQPASSFRELAEILSIDKSVDFGIMAIENSIAGSLLQNYRILRENQFWIIGEVYLRIKHNLMALPGQSISMIKEVHSHPMALNQCLVYLKNHKQIKLIESEDTALSAKMVMENREKGIAAIASEIAAELYNLQILASGIETSKVNYTRFFILQNRNGQKIYPKANKASIYLRVSHEKGSLLKVLTKIYDQGVNMSKLQSYPVLGQIKEYFFHIDLQFDNTTQYETLFESLKENTIKLEVLGIYEKANIYDNQDI